jgi:hypothetical protein
VFSTGHTYIWHLSKQLTKQQTERKEWRELINTQYAASDCVQKSERERVRQYLTGEKFDEYGAPDKKSLDEYQAKIGLDFKQIYKMIDEL